MLQPPIQFDNIGNGYLDYYPPHKVFHPGVDLNWGPTPDADLGKPVTMPAGAVIEYVSPVGTNGGLGLYMVARHERHAVWTRYCHLQSVSVAAGAVVPRGTLCAKVGKSGTATAHLHFEVLNDKGLAFIKDHWRPYGRYFGGLSRARVSSLTADPLAWLRDTDDDVPDWKDEVEKWATENKIIVDGWAKREDPMSQVRVAAALKNLARYLGKA